MNARAAARGFEFATLGIASVLKLNRLSVPPYQREYSWDKDRVTQLYEDLALAKSDGADYFLGTIVTIPKDADNILEIVDGQQRLTTTALFLVAIRNWLIENNSAGLIVESIENEFLSTIDRGREERVPRLILNVDDNDFFRQLIAQGKSNLEGARESHDRLIEAAKIAKIKVKQIVEQYGPQHRTSALDEWLSFLEHSAAVILLKAPDGAQAFRMFETLNDRGLKTSQVDLVKSFLFGQSNRRISEAQAKWSSMRNMLEEIDDDDRGINFLRHLLIATRQFTRADDVYSTVQTKIRGETNSLSFLSDMELMSRIYVATYQADSEHWSSYNSKAVQAIRVLNKFDIKPLRPLLLSLTTKFEATEASLALQYLVSLSVRLLIASTTRSGSIEETIAAVALDIWKGNIIDCSQLKAALSKIAPNDRVFADSFALATSSKADYARYYLRSLEHAIAGEAEPWKLLNDDPTAITLEHILPKVPNSTDWPEFHPDEMQKYTRRLGNMCLLQKTPNSNARSESFAEKAPLYKASPYTLTSHVPDSDPWSPAAINARQEMMAAVAIKAWPI